MAEAAAVAYDVFISYRHGGIDQAVAERLHRWLESYRTPSALVRRGIPARLQRVFRDQDELESSSSLSDSILNALHRSRYLIVVCSPRSRGSAWIGKEIEIFRSLGRGRQILALLIEGEPKDAFPPALFEPRDGEAAAEPLAADIRADGWWQRQRLQRIEFLRLVAPVLGCSFDDLRQRQQARTRQQLVAAMGVLLASTAAFAGIAAYALIKRSEAEQQEQLAIANAAEATSQRDQADAQRKRAEQITDKALRDQSRALAAFSHERVDAGDAVVARALALAGLPASATEPERPLVKETAVALERAVRSDRRFARFSTDNNVYRSAFSPDGKRLVVGTVSGSIVVWDIASRTIVRQLKVLDDVASGIDVSADGERLIVAGDNKPPRLINLVTGAQIAELVGHSDQRPVVRASFSPDGSRIVTGSFDNSAILWDGRTGKLIHRMAGLSFEEGYKRAQRRRGEGIADPVVAAVGNAQLQMMGGMSEVAFNPDGTLLATGGQAEPEGAVRIWDVKTGRQVAALLGHGDNMSVGMPNPITMIQFSPKDDIVATASSDRTIRLWNARTGKNLRVLRHPGHPLAIAFNKAGTHLVAGYGDGTARLWEVATGDTLAVLGQHEAEVGWVVFSPDDRLIATASSDGTARLWLAQTGRPLAVLRGHTDMVHRAMFSTDGRFLATNSRDGAVNLWRATDTGHLQVEMPAPPSPYWRQEGRKFPSGADAAAAFGFSRDGRHIAIREDSFGGVYVLDAVTGRALASSELNRFSYRRADGRIAFHEGPLDPPVMLDRDGALVDKTATKPTRESFQGVDDSAWIASPDGRRAVGRKAWVDATGQERYGSNDNSARWLIDTEKKTLLAELAVEGDKALGGRFSENGAVFVAPLIPADSAAFRSDSRRIGIWDAQTGRLKDVLTWKQPNVESVVVSADGNVVLAHHNSGQLPLVIDHRGKPKMTALRARTTWLGSMGLSDDGSLAAAGYSDGSVRLWRTADGQLITGLRGFGSSIGALAISTEAGMLVTADAAGVLRIWDLETAAMRFDLRIDRAVSAIKIATGGERLAALDNEGKLHLITIWPGWSKAPSTADAVDWARASETDELSPEDRRRFVVDAAGPQSDRAALPALAPIRPTIRTARTAADSKRPAALKECDSLAADPEDIARHASGVAFAAMDAQRALAACDTAVAEAAEDLAVAYQRARALDRMGRRDDAFAAYQAVAGRGYGAALRQFSLALRTQGARDNEAFATVVKAAEAGDPMALRGMARRYALGVEVERDVATAIRYALALDERSMAAAAMLVARVIEGNPDWQTRQEEAFFYYWLALRWRKSEDANEANSNTAVAAERVRILAYLLPPEAVVRAYRRAQTWPLDSNPRRQVNGPR